MTALQVLGPYRFRRQVRLSDMFLLRMSAQMSFWWRGERACGVRKPQRPNDASACRVPLYAGLHQHLDRIFLAAIRIGERTHPYLVSRDSRVQQRIADGNRPAVTEVAGCSTESATHGAVYPDFEGWILHQVSGDHRDWLHLGGR